MKFKFVNIGVCIVFSCVSILGIAGEAGSVSKLSWAQKRKLNTLLKREKKEIVHPLLENLATTLETDSRTVDQVAEKLIHLRKITDSEPVQSFDRMNQLTNLLKESETLVKSTRPSSVTLTLDERIQIFEKLRHPIQIIEGGVLEHDDASEKVLATLWFYLSDGKQRTFFGKSGLAAWIKGRAGKAGVGHKLPESFKRNYSKYRKAIGLYEKQILSQKRADIPSQLLINFDEEPFLEKFLAPIHSVNPLSTPVRVTDQETQDAVLISDSIHHPDLLREMESLENPFQPLQEENPFADPDSNPFEDELPENPFQDESPKNPFLE